jgi:FHS family L-fucose permease-like MFS transporter
MKLKTLPIFLVFFVMGFGDAVGALVGFVREEFNLPPGFAGLLPLFGFLAYGFFSVPIGVLADRKGQKFVLLLFLCIALLGELIPVISLARYVYVLVAIFLIGIGITALQVVGNPMMREVSAPGKFSRNLTFAQFIKSIGSTTAPYVLPLIVSLGFAWQGIFSIYAIVLVITILGVVILKIEKNTANDEKKASIKSSFVLLKDPFVLLMVLGIFLYVGAEVGLNSWIASFLQSKFNLDLEKMATLGIGFFLTALMFGRLMGSIILNFISARKFFVLTSILGVISILMMFLASQTIVLVALFIAGLAFANIFPLIFSILIDSMPERSNELSGLLVMAILGGAVVPALMGFIANYSIEFSFIVPLIILIYISFLTFYAAKKTPKTAAE